MGLVVLAKVGLITLLAMVLLFWVLFRVGGARTKYGVKAPLSDGPEEFLRIVRVQHNTVEQMVLFLPLLWVCALFFNPLLASVLGAIWLIARVWYALAYTADADKRHVPFLIAVVVNVVLFATSLIGVIQAIMIK